MTIDELIEELKKHPDQQSNVVIALRCEDDYWAIEGTEIIENGDLKLTF